MTPLQMAVVASTIANRGVRYKPYLVDSLYEYGTGDLISKTQPTIAEKINLNYDYVYDYIIGGMVDASKNMPAQYSISDLGFDVAIKTGTPQVGADTNDQNSFFIGFAPADNPEVAFAGVIEHGEYSKYMIRDILLAYQECYGLNGVPPKSQKLPEEVRPVLTTTSDSATSTTASGSTTTTTASASAASSTETSTASQTEPVWTVPPSVTSAAVTTQPADVPPATAVIPEPTVPPVTATTPPDTPTAPDVPPDNQTE